MFERAHHRRIAQVLTLLDADYLRQHRCLFGGGTALALTFGEYRESVDVDFLVSDVPSYRKLRARLKTKEGLLGLFPPGQQLLALAADVRADQYGVRSALRVDDAVIKFEVVLEGRISLDAPTSRSEICGVATLTHGDMVASKILANSDRFADRATFNRDLIDLAMMDVSTRMFEKGALKALGAYGPSALADLEKSRDQLLRQDGWMERCLEKMAVTVPKAVLWDRVKKLARRWAAVKR